MSSVKSLHTFSDIFPLLDTALAAKGAIIPFATRGAAIHWVQRANKARRAMLELEAEKFAKIPGVSPSTKYDAMLFSAKEDRVIITMRAPMAQIYDLDGNALEVSTDAPTITEDGLSDFAASFAKGLE
jgi:hypothetical protein